jgi:hypothetical protein
VYNVNEPFTVRTANCLLIYMSKFGAISFPA